MTRRSVQSGLLGLVLLLALTGCAGTAGTVTSTRTTAVRAPLVATATPSTADDLIGWPGAAGNAVDCAGPIIGTTRAAPYDGEDTGATPEAALEAGRRWLSWSGAQTGFSFAQEEDDRRLYVLDVDGITKQALIVRHGPALKGDGTRKTVTRWWLESWARCDYAELPPAVAREGGLQLWSNRAGALQLTSTIVSFDHSGDCFAGMTALDIDGPLSGGWSKDERIPEEYIRKPAAELRSSYFTHAYVDHVTVPDYATDSGYEHAGDRLWFSQDRAHAYVGTRSDAEAWPRAVRPIRCA